MKPLPLRTIGVITVACWLLLLAPVASAVPYNGEEAYVYRQPDGSTFSVRLYGDEYFAYQRTEEGYEITKDPQSGFWCYARLDASGQAFESTGIPVVTVSAGSRAANRSAAVAVGAAPAFQTLPIQTALTRVQKSRAEFRVDDKGRPLLPTGQLPTGRAVSGPYPAPPSRTTLGDFVGLCILVDFPDQPGTISMAQVDNYCNQPSGYTEFGNACSINEYFQIQSDGIFNFNNIVTAYVRMPLPKTYYDNNQDGTWGDSTAQELVSTALDILVAQGFDFTPLSRDGSGYIYSINVYYAGTCASGWSLGLWPHSWAIPVKVVDTANNIRAYRYQMSDMGTELDIGTFCHENGHMTCLYPDLYSYVTGGGVIGYYSLMSLGSHGGGGKHPTNVDPYLKIQSGWADVVEIDSITHVRGTAQEDRNYFYKYTNPAESGEYFLIENRNNTGYEGPYGGHLSSVTPGFGLAVWHVFEGGSNTYSSIQETGTYVTPYEAFIIEATPTGSYTPWYANPAPSPGSTDTFHATQGADPLDDASSPELHFWDHVGDTGRTVSSGMVVHDYDAVGPALSFIIGSGSPPATPTIGLTVSALTPVCDLGASPPDEVFNVFNAGGGTLNYAISDDATWLLCSPNSGSLTVSPEAITVTIDASALGSGPHTATITVTDAGASNSPQTIPVTLTVADAAVLAVTPATVADSLWPGQTSDTEYIAISNPGGGTMNYTIANSATWLTPAVASGSCSNEIDLVYLHLDATGLTAGLHTDTLTITAAGATNSPQTVDVELTVFEGIAVLTPNGGETWLTDSTNTIEWGTSSGTNVRIELLKGGVLDRVILASTANDGIEDWLVPADVTPGSDYRIRITTIDDVYTDDSDADFSIATAIYSANMTADPGWALQGQWAWGQPTGGGGAYGNPDPTSGYTGTNVVGYNLSGDYANSMATTEWTTTPVFDCSDYVNVRMSFYRWLGVERDFYDNAYLEVSANGVDWYRVWENDTTTLNGGAWEYLEYDLSAWADREPAVQLRWGMGPTDISWTYCGWNIDDVIVFGDYSPLVYHTVTFQTDGTPGATLAGTTPQTVLDGDDCTPVTANEPVGWHFVKWTLSGADYSTDQTLTVTNVTADMTLTAEYAINTYTLTYTAGPNGSITGTTPQTVNHGTDGSPVEAVPDTGYHFVQWSDASTQNPRTDTNVTTDVNVTASFALPLNPPLVTGAVSPTNDARPTWTWQSGGGGGAGYYRFGWSEGTWLSSDVTDTAYQPASALSDGTHTLYVQERDASNNWSDSGSYTVTVDTEPPGVSGVTADPSEANAGEMVTIGFTSSETLSSSPVVTVNGHPATQVGGKDAVAYTCVYVVQDPAVDPVGAAAIEITCVDSAGNSTVASFPALLTIVDAAPGVPALSGTLLALLGAVTLLAGVRVLRRRG